MVYRLLIRKFFALHFLSLTTHNFFPSFLVERIISLNVFDCPRTPVQDYYSPRSPEQKEQDKVYHTTGIFIKASYFNHSCYPNARRSFIGDMIIVRATRDIPADSEILIWYVPPQPGRTWEQAQEGLQSWGFQCSCVLCQQDKKTTRKIRARRDALSEDLMAALLEPAGGDAPKAERLLAAIEKTYSAPAEDVPRLELRDPYFLLTRIYASENRPQDVIRTAFKFLSSVGCVIARRSSDSPNSSCEVLQWGLLENEGVEIWMQLWVACEKVAPHLCGRLEEYARISYKISIGEDQTFETVGKRARETMFEGV